MIKLNQVLPMLVVALSASGAIAGNDQNSSTILKLEGKSSCVRWDTASRPYCGFYPDPKAIFLLLKKSPSDFVYFDGNLYTPGVDFGDEDKQFAKLMDVNPDNLIPGCSYGGKVSIQISNPRLLKDSEGYKYLKATLHSISEKSPIEIETAYLKDKSCVEGMASYKGQQASSTRPASTGFPADLSKYTSIFPGEGMGPDIISNQYVRQRLQALVPTKWSSRSIKDVWTTSGVEHQGAWTYFSMCKAHDCGSLNINVFLNSIDQSMTVFTTDMSSLSTDQVLAMQKRGDQTLFLRYITCKITGRNSQSIPDNLLNVVVEGNFLVDYDSQKSGRAVASLKTSGCVNVE